MSSTSESGHAKNAGNFDIIVSASTEQGELYKPSHPALLLTALKALNTSAKESLGQVNVALSAYNKLSGERSAAFDPMNELLTRVIRSLKSCGTTKAIIDNAASIIRKIKGTRVSAKLTEEEKKALADMGKEQKEISVSQLSFDNRLNNFDALIKHLETVAEYKPNETGLQVTTLKTMYTTLDTVNSQTKKAGIVLSNARVKRNEIFYTAGTGLVDIALDVKSYFISAFGSHSPQYNQISKLKFKRVE